MSLGTAIALVREAVMETLIIAGPILLVGMVVGLIVAILQATTSIQEQTLTFVPKIAAILISLVIFGRFLMQSLVEYTKRLFESIPNI
ncbi:MAG: flagellar biosynthesis protein FliQ [Spirochaetes bacterium]|jgi:flagellar biosynthetic protein FliQ|nr:flagellar biosynthesis protein FliQ [Spirochaetota bacterium]